MSSGRESVGDLIPQDVLEVFAQERQSRRGKRSRRRNTFGRAFSWLKGRRRKTPRQNKDINIELLTPGLPVSIPLPSTNTGPSMEGMSCPVQHTQENVFTEGNRPKYVQDLHTEAQEGLKLLQHDENRNGVDYQDDQSIISTVTARTDDDVSFSELGMSESESTVADTISTRSVTSYQSSRSGLTRQGSTFRPLKEDKKQKKGKSKKKAGMVAGIPRHVQKELGLDRAAWIASQFTDGQLSNGGLSISTVIPTPDSISIASVPDGAIMDSLRQTLTEEIRRLPAQKGQQYDHNLSQSFDSQSSSAYPWMPTLGNSSSSPVMYVSPEATYMSKIIPNAILPPSVDVVELSRNRSRSSVRMVSKSSLASASPAPSRASSRASSRISSRAPSRISSRVSSRASSRQTATFSECSGWSRSGSSETLVSDSSTISNSSTPRIASRTSQAEDSGGPQIVKHYPGVQNIHFKAVNGNNQPEEAWKTSESTGEFNHRLSVIKKKKKPPPPPSRSYSLHTRANARTIPGHKEVESPYSTYLSQNGNTSNPSKDNWTGQRTVLAELQLKKVLQMHTGNSPYSKTNGGSYQNNLKHFLPSIKSLTTNGLVASPAVSNLLALLDIPDPPKVIAPPPPPPEAWAHSHRTFELLCGPGPVNFERWAQKRDLKIEIPVQLNQETSATKQGTNLMKENIETSKIQIQKSMATDMQYRTTSSKVSVNVQPPYGNTLLLPRLTHVRPSPSPSPPPEHIPPLPPKDQVITLKEDASNQCQEPIDDVICPPPHPLFPPPPPPTKLPASHPPGGWDETDIQSTPMPPSLHILFNVPHYAQSSTQPPPPSMIPPPPSMIPPAPQLIPPAPPAMPTSSLVKPLPSPVIPRFPTSRTPPPPAIPSVPAEIPTPPKQTQLEVSSKPAQITYTPINIPLPPPLPSDIRKEGKTITAEIQEKQPSLPTTHTIASTGESPPPMITPSLLQKVRLRTIRSNTSQAETPEGPSKLMHQTNQEAPQKPIRRSLILTTSDILLQSETDQKDDTVPTNILQGTSKTTPQSDTLPQTKSKILSQSSKQVSLAVVSQVSITDQRSHQGSSEPIKESVAALSVHQTDDKAEPEPKITLQEIQTVTTEPSTMQTQAETKNQLPANDDTKEVQNDSSETEDKQNSPLVQIEQNGKLSRPQTLMLTPSKTAQKVPSASVPSTSMCLQQAIRLKTAALSTDNQAKRLSLLHSPPSSTGAISPTSTANFIFSKSTKKVVIEKYPSSPESKSDSRKTLQEMNSVSRTSKPAADPHYTKAKVPPPVARKPSAKSDNIIPNSSESNVDSVHVQTAGQ